MSMSGTGREKEGGSEGVRISIAALSGKVRREMEEKKNKEEKKRYKPQERNRVNS